MNLRWGKSNQPLPFNELVCCYKHRTGFSIDLNLVVEMVKVGITAAHIWRLRTHPLEKTFHCGVRHTERVGHRAIAYLAIDDIQSAAQRDAVAQRLLPAFPGQLLKIGKS